MALIAFGRWQLRPFAGAMIAGMWLQRFFADLRHGCPLCFASAGR